MLTSSAKNKKGAWKWKVGKWKSKTQPAYPNGDDYRIRLSSLDDSVSDESDADFAIGSPVSVEVIGPATVSSGATAQYQCLARFDFGDDQDVTSSAKWKVLRPKGSKKVAKMGKKSTAGLITVKPDVPAVQNCTVTASFGGYTGGLPVVITP